MENKELKTLKDLQGNIGNAEYFHREGQEPTNDYGDVIIVNELKAEAIKWVKEDKKILDSGEAHRYSQLKNWMKRFNLTDEDLK